MGFTLRHIKNHMLARYAFVYNRKNKTLKRDETALVQLRITIDRKAKYYSTGIYVPRHTWRGGDRNWIVGIPEANDYNSFLESILQRLRSAEIKAKMEDRAISHDEVSLIIRNKKPDVSFVVFIRREVAARKDLTAGSKKRTLSIINKLEALGIKLLSDLTVENIKKADNILRERGEKDSTIDGFHGQVSAYIKRAIAVDLMKFEDNPYLKFERKKARLTDRKYLTAEELKRIEAKDITIKRLAEVRDVFVFCCYTGLSFSDVEKLRPQDIIEENGKRFIQTFRKKTEEKSTIYLLKKAAILIEKYKDDRPGYCFPVNSNQRMNSYLKEIADISGIEKNLTTHVARHTFATTVMLAQGVSLEVTSKALGHASIKTTQVYAKMLSNRIADEMSKLE